MKTDTELEKTGNSVYESSFLAELWMLIHAKKKYWLMPIIITLLLLGVLVVLSGTAAAPFIYTLF